MATSSAEAYGRDGFVTGIDVFGTSEMSSFRAEFDRLVEQVGRDTSQNAIVHRHFDVPFIWQMATDRRMLDLMEQIMGPDVMLLSTGFFCKYPEKNARAFVGWHQDTHYWGLDPPVAFFAWIAVDDSDAANGAMQVVRGSHVRGAIPHGTSEREGNLLRIHQQEVSSEHIPEDDIVTLELRAGQVSVHHGLTLHGSQPNRSDRRRCGLTVRYITPDVRQSKPNSSGTYWKPILLRGEDRYEHYPRTSPPFPMDQENHSKLLS
jgi:hypothetical protein